MLDKRLGDMMPTLNEKRLRGVHERAVKPALRPSGIGEVRIDDKCFQGETRKCGQRPACRTLPEMNHAGQRFLLSLRFQIKGP
jgi:hypothetical protein